MDKYIERLSEQLHVFLLKKPYTYSGELLKETFETKTEEKLDKRYYELFIETVAYIYSRHHKFANLFDEDVPALTSPIIEGDVPFRTFREYMRNYIGLEVSKDSEVVVEKEDYYRFMSDTIANTLLKEEGYWNRVDSSKIKSKDKEDEEIARLFIPVNNSCLYLFSTLLLSSMEAKDLEYNFKVNTDQDVQKGNSVEINVTAKNYEQVIDIIKNITYDYPQIIIDREKLPILSYPVNDDVGIVPITNGKNFETDLADKIIEYKSNSNNYADLINKISNYSREQFSSIKNLIGELPINDDNKLL